MTNGLKPRLVRLMLVVARFVFVFRAYVGIKVGDFLGSHTDTAEALSFALAFTCVLRLFPCLNVERE